MKLIRSALYSIAIPAVILAAVSSSKIPAKKEKPNLEYSEKDLDQEWTSYVAPLSIKDGSKIKVESEIETKPTDTTDIEDAPTTTDEYETTNDAYAYTDESETITSNCASMTTDDDLSTPAYEAGEDTDKYPGNGDPGYSGDTDKYPGSGDPGYSGDTDKYPGNGDPGYSGDTYYSPDKSGPGYGPGQSVYDENENIYTSASWTNKFSAGLFLVLALI
jgi:hypothetical protein